MSVGDVIGKVDRYQREHPWLGFVLAVRQKYSEDQGGYLAATTAYYGFFSLFPLLLVLTTVLGWVLRGHRHLEDRIVGSALGQFPIIGSQLQTRSLNGSALALGLGLAGALWAGMGCVLAAQNAMNQLWGVPFTQRPDFLRSRLRALVLLGVLGGGLLGTTVLSALGTAGARYGIAWKLASIGLSTVLDFGLFWVGFRSLTAKSVTWRDLRVGAAVAAVGYELLQLAGGYYIGNTLAHSGNTYGTFALVIGLLSFIYLAVHVTLLAAEINVVATHRLWPRSLSIGGDRSPTAADRSALTQRSRVETRRHDERIDVELPVAEEPDTQDSDEPRDKPTQTESGGIVKLVYKPFGIAFGVFGGMLAAALFKRTWKVIAREDDAPSAKDLHRTWKEVLLSASLQGAIFGGVKALVDRAGATGFQRATGVWPGDTQTKQERTSE